MRNPHILLTFPILHFFGLFKVFLEFIWVGWCLIWFITLRRWWNDFQKNRKPKILKKKTRARRMWGILTFFVPSPFSTSLDFLTFVGTSNGLDDVEIFSLHLRGGEMISKKIQIQAYSKSNNGAKNVRIPHILHTLLILDFFEVFKICWDFIWVGCCLNRFITLTRWSNDFRKNLNPKILINQQGYEECNEF